MTDYIQIQLVEKEKKRRKKKRLLIIYNRCLNDQNRIIRGQNRREKNYRSIRFSKNWNQCTLFRITKLQS